MDRGEKRIFINELVENVKKDIIADLDLFPEEWDGVELRWYIKEAFSQAVFSRYQDKRSRRYKDFRNYCIVTPLKF